MPLDLLAPLARLLPPANTRPVWPTGLPGESSYGRVQPANYNSMVKADNSWVFACARINAQSVGKVKLRLFQRAGVAGVTSDDQEITDHIFLDLMRNVNPYMNEFDLKEITDLYMELVGNAYWYLAPTRLAGVNGRMIPGEIYPLLAHYMRVIPGKDRMVDGYMYLLPQMPRPVAFTPEEIIQFKFPNPDSPYYGKGCVEGGHYAIDSNMFQKEYEIALFKNMARPDGVLTTADELSDVQVERLRTMWNSLYQGASRSGNIAILEKGLTYTNTAFNPKELDYLRGRIATREEICAMFGVPPSKLGLTEHVNRANAETNDFTYQSETVLPRLRRMEQKINEQLLPIYDPNLYVKFDDPVPENREFALTKMSAYLDRGVVTINEVREQDGEEPVPWGDLPYSMAGTGNPSEPPSQTPIATPTGPEAPKGVGKASDTQKRYQFVRVITPTEKRFFRDLQDYFVQQRRLVETNLEHFKRASHGILKAHEPLAAHLLFPKAKEEERLRQRSQPFVEQAVKVGAEFGASQTGADVNFDVLNQSVLHAIDKRVAFFAKRVTATVAQDLTDTIGAGVTEGETIMDIAARIDDLYQQLLGFRSLRIARTEVVSASNVGSLLSYRAAGIKTKRWLTAQDEHVRETHQEAEGQEVGINQSFMVGGDWLDHPGDPAGSPEEIINCFPGDVRVQAVGVERLFRRWYVGQLIVVTTASGHDLSGTMNHPVLTNRGWIAFGKLQEGDCLIRSGGHQEMSLSDPDVQEMPPTFSEITNAFANALNTQRVRGGHMDFHGDGHDGDVEIINTDRLLKMPYIASAADPSQELAFSVSHHRQRLFTPSGDAFTLKRGSRFSSERHMGGLRQSESFSPSRAFHSHHHALTASTEHDPLFEQTPSDHGTRDAIPFRKRFLRSPGLIALDECRDGQRMPSAPELHRAAQSPDHRGLSDSTLLRDLFARCAIPITFDKIVRIQPRQFRGHVYTLQTKSGWFIANNIIAQNCRCTVEPVFA